VESLTPTHIHTCIYIYMIGERGAFFWVVELGLLHQLFKTEWLLSQRFYCALAAKFAGEVIVCVCVYVDMRERVCVCM